MGDRTARLLFSLFLGAAMLTGLLCRSAVAQRGPAKGPASSAGESKNTTKIQLASNSGPPGTAVVLPIYFTPEQGVEVGRVKLQVIFPSANLKFEKIERGIAKNVELSSNVSVSKSDKGVQMTTVTVIASVSSSESARKGLAAGMIGALDLRISPKAPHGIINLRTVAEAAELETDRPLKNVRGGSAKVDVAWVDAPPSVTCFFFSH